MTWETPNRDKWFKVEARSGSSWNTREDWCSEHCQHRFILQNGSKITEFESEKDAFAFALRWT